jgi:cytoskeletal protein RodZ
MEAFGTKLRDARNARNLDLDQVSRETNITRRYLEALENEDFTVFPGEPYLLGFLRNYCDYLGLNTSEIVSSYKNLKIQEAPVPLKDLMPKRPITDVLLENTAAIRVALIGVIAVVAILLIWGGIRLGASLIGSVGQGEEANLPAREPVTHEAQSEQFKARVYEGDTILVATAAGRFTMTVAGTSPSLKLDTPSGSRVVDLGQDLLIDLSGDSEPDVKVFVADLFRNDPSKGAEIELVSGSKLVNDASSLATQAAAEAAAPADVTVAPSQATANPKQLVLFEGGSAYPVTMNATFRGYCLFRYESDRANREERYYQKSELLTVQANNGIRIWASNGNAVKIQIVAGGKTVDLEISRPGEVIVRDLKWIKDEDTGRFKFVVFDID